MSQENVEIVRRGYELFAEGNLEGVTDLISDEAELPDGGGLGVGDTAAGTRRGPDGFLQGSQDALDAFEDYRVEPQEFIEAGDAVVVPVRISGRGKASGAMLEIRLVHLWVLRNGRAIRNEIYRTTAEALKAVGRSE
ncbi:MAG TPA: nuclear transport factor 2 family protein [Beijerinckiaceae bacterium]|jgi:ketosteroid isomerase-like protein|nr:nuclear transport factor 2 family protein [Beijerinckiaceae bacterium]